ncbi:MAG: alpha/beta fold hydrolase [Terriglobales bacterium]
MFKKLIWVIAILLVLIVIGAGLLVWRHPLEVFAWMNRGALVNAGLMRHTVQTPAGPQVVFEGGKGPTLVLLHGAGDQAGTWAKIVPNLTERYHVVALDLPGHGDSAPPSGPLSMTTMLQGTEAVLNRYPPPLIVVGNSLGAWIAMLYAREHPDRVARLVAVDGGPLRGERQDLARLPVNREEARRLFDAVLDPGAPRVPDFVVDDVVRDANRGPMARMTAARDDLQKYLLDDLGDVSVPVDLLWGESDKLVPLDYAKKMEAALPAARLTSLPRCGHVPQQECPVAFGSTLQSLLREPPPQRKPVAVPASAKTAAK